jgi:hypothetical protein
MVVDDVYVTAVWLDESCTWRVLPEMAAIVPETPLPAACPLVDGCAPSVVFELEFVDAAVAEHPLRRRAPAATTVRIAPARLSVGEVGRESFMVCSVDSVVP